MSTIAPSPERPTPGRADDLGDPVGPTGDVPPRRRSWIVVLVAVAVAVPIVLAGTSALGAVWRPSGDWAVLALRVDDVGSSTPLVGPYSRYGWNHPGPMLYWALAGPYHLLGREPVDLLFGTALLNAVAAAGTAVLAWRRGRLPLLLMTAAGLALLARGLGPEVLRDPWNPYITLLPLALFAFLAWSIAEGDRWTIPIAVVVGSFLVQSHVGYAVVVAALTATATAMALLDHLATRRAAPPTAPGAVEEDRAHPDPATRGPWWRPPLPRWSLVLATSLLVAGLCWYPVAFDQVEGSGNLRGIADYFTSSQEATTGVADALGIAARQLALPSAPWLGAAEPVGPSGGQVPAAAIGVVVPFALFALALVSAWRTGQRSAVRFQVLVGVSTIAGLVATARITDEPYNYLVRWWWVVAALFWISTAWSFTSALVHRTALAPRTRRAVAWVAVPLAAVVLLGTSASTAMARDAAGVPDGSLTRILGEVAPDTVAALDGYGPVLVRATGSVWGTAADGLRLEIERSGVPVVTDPDDAYRLGPERNADTRPPVATVWVVSAEAASAWQRRPDLELVASWDPLDPLERAGHLVASAELQRQLEAAGRPDLARNVATGGDTSGVPSTAGVDPRLAARVEEVRRRGDPISVFIGPPPLPR